MKELNFNILLIYKQLLAPKRVQIYAFLSSYTNKTYFENFDFVYLFC